MNQLVACFAALFLLAGCRQAPTPPSAVLKQGFSYESGAIIRGDSTRKTMALVFTADEFGEGGDWVRQVLQRQQVKASFFFTGNFYRNDTFRGLIAGLHQGGHYLGAHSDRHLLYCAWENRDSLLVSRQEFLQDLDDNYREMARFGIKKQEASFFLPPYEWFNDSIRIWTADYGLQLINYTPGTRSHADYTTPGMRNYQDSETIFQSIIRFENSHASGLNGFILLSHIGAGSERTDKFFHHLEDLIQYLKEKGYTLERVDELLRK